MNKNPLLDDEFLKELYRHREKEIFAKIIALTLNNDPIEEIQGQVTGGSVNLDGSSSVRRTCNLTLVAKDMNINQYYWGLKTRFRLYIGLRNVIGWGYDEIIWFPMGTYVISNFNTSQSTSNYTITITGKDKMTLLNGELSGSLFASVDFGKEEYYDKNTKKTTITPIPIKQIIREAVHAYADEVWENIIVNDLEDYGIELLDYKGSNPMYLYFKQGKMDNTKDCYQAVIKGETIVYPVIDGIISPNGVQLDNIGKDNNYKFDRRIKLNLSGVEIEEPTVFAESQTTKEEDFITIAQVLNGETCGYRLTEITYPGDLILSIGQPLTALFDKLVAMLGNFEYFYDIDGRFIFQRKQTFVDKTWNNIRTDNDTSYIPTAGETYAEAAAYATPLTWTFGDGFLITAYANSPVLNNVRNDFSIWGARKSIADNSELPVHLRYAVDKKPRYYKTLPDTRADYLYRSSKIFITRDYFNELYNGDTTLLETKKHYYEQNDKTKECVEIKEEDMDLDSETTYIVKNNSDIIICDWREIIFQMALDYRKHNHEDEFYINVRKVNGLDENNEWRFPNGKTGYEQYYVDMEGFWRQLYCPPQLMEKVFDKYDIKTNPTATGVWTDRQTDGGWEYKIGPIYPDTNSGVYFSNSKGIFNEYKEIGYSMHTSFNFDGEWINSWVNDQDINDGWNTQVLDSPETLNFWIDFLEADEESDLVKYSIPAIGDRAKSVNDNMVKAIYFRETPNALFTDKIQTVERKSGYTYLNYGPTMANLFNISSQGKSAINVMEEYINLYLYCIESISITSVPIYNLQPNTRVMVYDQDSKINGEYLVSRISIPLAYNGTMTVSATKSAEIIY